MVEFLERLSVLLSVKLYHLDDIESVRSWILLCCNACFYQSAQSYGAVGKVSPLKSRLTLREWKCRNITARLPRGSQ